MTKPGIPEAAMAEDLLCSLDSALALQVLWLQHTLDFISACL